MDDNLGSNYLENYLTLRKMFKEPVNVSYEQEWSSADSEGEKRFCRAVKNTAIKMIVLPYYPLFCLLDRMLK